MLTRPCLLFVCRCLLFGAFGMIAARIAWQIWPNLWTCALFWAMASVCIFSGGDPRRQPVTIDESQATRAIVFGALIVLGATMNAAVTLANGGFMPVTGEVSRASVWVTSAEAHRLRWLGDNYFGFSAGDLVILGGLVPSLLAIRRQPLPRPERKPIGMGAWRVFAGFSCVGLATNVWDAPVTSFVVLGAVAVLYIGTLFFEWWHREAWARIEEWEHWRIAGAGAG